MREETVSRLANTGLGIVCGSTFLFSASYFFWRRSQLGFLTPPDTLVILVGLTVGLISLGILARGGRRLKSTALWVTAFTILVEIQLQLLAFGGILPRVSFFEEVPYSRVYWTKEGFSNGWMNRYGWHYPEFETHKPPRRVALIGDSFIEALQVEPSKNIGVILERLINVRVEDPDKKLSVIALGKGGFGPATFLEVLRFAKEHYNVSDVVVFISLGSAFKNTLVEIESKNGPHYLPSRYMYYDLSSDNQLVLHPESPAARSLLNHQLEMNQTSLFLNLPGTMKANCVLLMAANQIYQNLTIGNGLFAGKSSRSDPLGPGMPGIEALAFERRQSALAKKAMGLVKGLLDAYQQYSDREGITLMVVTIPWFPGSFYSSRDWIDWGFESGKYDFLLPEIELIGWCRERNIAFLPMGHFMKQSQTDVDSIKSLYYSEGSGHWTPRGHKYWAKAICDRFYTKAPRSTARAQPPPDTHVVDTPIPDL